MSADLVLLEFTVEQIDSMTMPEDPGSMLRGAFGHALKSLSQAAQMFNKIPNISKPNNNEASAYGTIFEYAKTHTDIDSALTKYGIPNPYVLKLPSITKKKIEEHDQWQFSQLLIGTEAIQHINIVILAWSQALQNGIGNTHNQYQASLTQVMCGNICLYDGIQLFDFSVKDLTRVQGVKHSQIYNQLSQLNDSATCQLRLRFTTQFRAQQKGKIAYSASQLDMKLLMYSIYNRVMQCHQIHDTNTNWELGLRDFKHFKCLVDHLSFSCDLQSSQIRRYSNRQQRSMTLFGLKGTIDLQATKDTLLKILPVLYLGELLNVGKSTVLGLGHYELQLVAC